ncbi:hypothetical protein Bca52824_005352 [Brassica carinata]|uniref:RING-type E3 ubiquitin transferase n=1 Tax=Brassica carinata TaxID=52824 RepID=A0A8X7WRE4_BRACI|nr:hypothetical protein Bca52824_005352 [Brassica carinata]
MVAAKKMKVPCCSVCHTRYNEDERVPLLLQCGHGFCRDCLSKMFSSSPTPPSPAHAAGLRKNFAMLALVGGGGGGGNFDCDYTDDSDEDDEDDDDGDDGGPCSSSRGGDDKSKSSCGPVIEVGAHPERSGGVEMWDATVAGRRCKHRVAVKKVCLRREEEMDVDWMQGQLESLRKASMWCRNVCTFHGVVKVDGSLCLLMDRCFGSVQSEMERNEGRLTLEQILRYGADVARGVAELHAAGVICMNIKPSNLLLDASGNVVVSDYGLAPILKKPTWQKTRPELDSSKVTPCSTECVTLSPHYTAPEAWGPVKKLFWEDASGVSPESDAWSFGCTLVEMCTGSTPWDGLSREEIFQAVVKARKVPPQYERIVGVGIPRELWKMIGECLQFKPSKRPTFNAMLATFLRHLQEIPRSPSASPDNGFVKVCGVNVVEETRATNTGVLQDNPFNLHRVVLEGDSEGVRNILAKAATGSGGSSVRYLLEAQNADGQSALHLACRRGSVELVEAILEYGEANVDIVDKDGDPPLVFALAAGSPQCVHVLIKKGANVRSRLREGSGPSVAHVCSYHGQPDCMRELLVAGADPNAVDDEGETVLHRAVTKKYTDCAIVILENGGSRSMAVSNGKGLTPLHMCVSTWNVAVIKRWVEVSSPEEISQAINIPSPVGTALCMAAAIRKDHEKEGRELVQILLAAGADPTAQDAQHGRTALHTAAMANNVELVRVILDAGVNANIRNVHNTIPFTWLWPEGRTPDDEGDNAFHIAADAAKMIRENLDWLIVMLRRPDAAVDVRNHSGKTVRDFLEALPREWISEDLMEALLKRGVHLSPTIYEIGDWVKFKRGITTPLHGWQGAKPKSVGFVQTILEKEDMIVAFCSGEARVLASEVVKLIPLDRGQHVRLRNDVKEPRFGWRGQSRDSVGTVLCVDEDGILRVGFPGASRGWKADPAEMERVEEFKVGDWVRIRQNLTSAKHGFGSVVPGSMGIVYCVRPDSSLLVELSYLPNPWHCEPEEVEPATPFRIGDRVCVKRSVAEPRYAWGGETHHSVGKISEIENDGLLIIEIPNRPIPWQADPSDMEKIDDFKVGDWVRVKASVSSPKYGWEDITRNSIGVMHSLDEDGDVGIAFCFRSKPFSCSVTDIEKVVPFHVGQEIHMIPSIAQPRLGWSNETPATIGKIMRIDMDGTLSAQVTGRQTLWKVSPGDAELLSGFEVGDWVRSKPSLGNRPSYDWFSEAGYLELACCFRKGRWSTHYTDLEKIPSLKAGQFVHFQKGLTEPRWGWRGAKPDSRGIITTVHADGEVRVAFFGLPGLWKGDPADLGVERMFEVGEWVRLKEGVPSWKSIGPGSVGVVHGVGYEGDEWDGTISVSFCGEQERWSGSFTHLEKAKKLVVGQKTRVKLAVKQPRFGWSGHSHGSVGTIAAIDADGKLRIYTPAGSKTWMLDPSEVETIEEEELKIGDWVRVKPSITTPTYQWGEVNPSSIGVVHRMEDGDLWVSFCFLDRLWLCKAVEMERIRPFGIGDKVKIKNGLVTPRWGHVVGVDANGKLRIKFLWREGRPWIGDPADIVLDEPSG